jgi:predicted phosphodiesterase
MSTLSIRLASFLLAAAVCAVGAGCTTWGTTRPAGVTVEAPIDKTEVIPLPNRQGSLKFGVLGDFGTGDRDQYEMGQQIAAMHGRFKFQTVVLLGDNLYGADRPQDFANKFERPYKLLLDNGVKFYASLGNHDSREQRYYKPFNMDGKLYYTFSPAAEVRFFVLESSYPVPEQIKWLEDELKKSSSKWKIAYFHHPLYSSGDRHGSDLRLRATLEPLFVKYNVSVVLQGHDHFYERIKPQNGISYFVVGAGGKLRDGRNRSAITAAGFDSDLTFMGAEIIDDQMYFNVISRTGQLVDSGVITRRIENKGP